MVRLRMICIVLSVLTLSCQGISAQEVSGSNSSWTSTERTAVTNSPMASTVSRGIFSVTDFFTFEQMRKLMKINPDAVKINWKDPAIYRWDGGRIIGFGGSSGMYLSRYAGIDLGNGKWGLAVGVQRGYNPLTGQWELMPMATPYINVGGVPLGFDVGGAIYSILRDAATRNDKGDGLNGRSGIIPPPIEFKVGFSSAPEIPAWMEKQFDKQ